MYRRVLRGGKYGSQHWDQDLRFQVSLDMSYSSRVEEGCHGFDNHIRRFLQAEVVDVGFYVSLVQKYGAT